MPFQSRLDRHGPKFAENRAAMLALLERLAAVKDRARTASERRRPTFEARGQLTPRQRLASLLDPGMPYLELFGMANFMVETPDRETSIPGASLLSGIGYVSGTRCMIVASDSGIAAGSMTPITADKLLACQDIALDKKLPFVHLIESAGANLMQYQVENWAKGGGVFMRLARLSARGIPTIAILHGPSTAGGAYFPGLSDYVIAVRGRGRMSLGGAALVKAATGEVASEEDLAGTDMHATVSGTVEYVAEDDGHGLQIARDLIARLDWNRGCRTGAAPDFDEPLHDADDIAGLVPLDYRTPYDVREIILRIVDGSVFEDFKPDYGRLTVCVQAAICGSPVGVIGNNGPIDPDAATKATQFMQLCDQAQMPLIFLHNITGYMVGKAYEQAGMIKHGSKMIQAVTNVRVPKLSIHVGATFGAGNYGMAGYAYEPDFLFTWPNAVSGVMGGEQAARTMEQVARTAAARRGTPVDETAMSAQSAQLSRHFDEQSDAFYTSGRLLDMGIIDPRDTRRVLGFCLLTCLEAASRTVQPNTFGVARP